MFSMIHMLVPVISFHINHDYIKTHLCRSLTQPEFSDCDGFCYLKKQIEEHEDHDMDSHGTTAQAPKVPFVYLPEIRSKNPTSAPLSEINTYFMYQESFPDDIFLDIVSPPPQV